ARDGAHVDHHRPRHYAYPRGHRLGDRSAKRPWTPLATQLGARCLAGRFVRVDGVVLVVAVPPARALESLDLGTLLFHHSVRCSSLPSRRHFDPKRLGEHRQSGRLLPFKTLVVLPRVPAGERRRSRGFTPQGRMAVCIRDGCNDSGLPSHDDPRLSRWSSIEKHPRSFLYGSRVLAVAG